MGIRSVSFILPKEASKFVFSLRLSLCTNTSTFNISELNANQETNRTQDAKYNKVVFFYYFTYSHANSPSHARGKKEEAIKKWIGGMAMMGTWDIKVVEGR